MDLVSLTLLTLAVSIDAFVVGVSYGLQRIILPISSRLLIALTSGLAIRVSAEIGHFLVPAIGPRPAQFLGALILMVLGVWVILNTSSQSEQVRRRRKQIPIAPMGTAGESQAGETALLTNIRLKPLGIVVQILREPASADFDRSGSITLGEAFFLGIALAFDALGAGLGAGLTGESGASLSVAVLLTNYTFLYLGSLIALNWGEKCWFKPRAAALPGYLLIALALFKSLAARW